MSSSCKDMLVSAFSQCLFKIVHAASLSLLLSKFLARQSNLTKESSLFEVTSERLGVVNNSV